MKPISDRTHDDELREQGLQLVTRLVALLRTGRSYSIGNQAFTAQLEQLLILLRPTLFADGHAQVAQIDGDLYLNAVRVPLRPSSVRSQAQLHSEFALREIDGVRFEASLQLRELEAFMHYFLPSELYKGAELVSACQAAGITAATAVLHAQANDGPMATQSYDDTAPAFSQALQAYDTALRQARALLAPARFERGIELHYVKRVLQPLIEAAATEEPAIVGLAWATAEDDACVHGMHVSLVSIAMGVRLGLDRAALAELAVAALLHDIGQSAAPEIPTDHKQRDEEDRARQAAHVTMGVAAIARNTTLNRTSLRSMRVALEHHAWPLDGHPALAGSRKPSTASRLIAVADAFVSMSTLHGETGRRMTPHTALGSVLASIGEGREPALAAALVRAVGLYPPGQVIELDDHSLARALAPSSGDPERPIVELLTTSSRTLLPARERLVMPLANERSVARALPIDEWPDFSGESAAA